jgi:hypothetical protein
MPRRRVTAAVAVLLIAPAGCGGGDDESSGSGASKPAGNASSGPVEVKGSTTGSMTEFAFRPKALARRPASSR